MTADTTKLLRGLLKAQEGVQKMEQGMARVTGVRNDMIFQAYGRGVTVPVLANIVGLSEVRVHQIIDAGRQKGELKERRQNRSLSSLLMDELAKQRRAGRQ